jgi:hypothetical protein
MDIFKSLGHKPPIKEETAHNKKNAFSKMFLEFFFWSITIWRRSIL